MLSPYPNEVFSAFAFIGFVLSLIPLRWHLMAWNTGTVMYMMWSAIGCLNMFINSIVWKGSAINYSPVWCDISTHIMAGLAVALPACSLCINRRLYYIAHPTSVHSSTDDRRRALFIDLAIGVGLPVLQMIAYTIPQGHRFNIFEDIGCMPTTFNTPLAYVFVYSWPLIIGLVSAVYSVLTIRAFWERRKTFHSLMKTNKFLTVDRYFRLMALAACDILFTIPLSCWIIATNLTISPLHPWISWADTHLDFWVVVKFPSAIWHTDNASVVALELNRWFPIIFAIVFFGFFGFAEEARKNYRSIASTVTKHTFVEKFVSLRSKSAGEASTFGTAVPTLPTSSFGKSFPTLNSTDSATSVHKVKDLDDFDDKESFGVDGSLSSRFSLEDTERQLPPTPRSPTQKGAQTKPRDGSDMV